jgi:predicted unusual protein kinase regulating ubiquinone biosynthesis (AarF/ABC1/UbiB family)
LLLPDDRIGLIDFGATKHLTRNERLMTCLVYAALYRKDEQLLVDMAQVNGYKSKYGRKDIIMTLMQFGYDTWSVIPPGQNMVQVNQYLYCCTSTASKASKLSPCLAVCRRPEGDGPVARSAR